MSTEQEWLAENGWSQETTDTCWLDCTEPGHRKTWHRSVIVLCVPHARVLEAGKLTFRGRAGRWSATYRGAPLPADSMAAEWPWRRQSDLQPV